MRMGKSERQGRARLFPFPFPFPISLIDLCHSKRLVTDGTSNARTGVTDASAIQRTRRHRDQLSSKLGGEYTWRIRTAIAAAQARISQARVIRTTRAIAASRLAPSRVRRDPRARAAPTAATRAMRASVAPQRATRIHPHRTSRATARREAAAAAARPVHPRAATRRILMIAMTRARVSELPAARTPGSTTRRIARVRAA